MQIVIVGAGLAGLTAALALALNKHKVVVLERHSQLPSVGTGINIRPAATQLLEKWGLAEELAKIGDQTPAVMLLDLWTGEPAMSSIVTDASPYIDYGTSRSKVIDVLYRKAIEAGAIIRFGTHIEKVGEDCKHANVRTTDDRTYSADLVLAADGVRSPIRQQILGHLGRFDPQISSVTFYGIQLNEDDLPDLIGAKRLLNQHHLNVFKGPKRFVVSRHNRVLKIVGGLFGIEGETDQKGLWDENGDIQYVRDAFKGCCPELQVLLETAQSCDRWRLAELPDLPRWTSQQGRIALLGDSAHGMHPNAAHGYSQTVEDVGVLCDFLEKTQTGSITGTPQATYLWQLHRKPRTERIKAWARWNTKVYLKNQLPKQSRNSRKPVIRSVKHTKGDMNAHFDSKEFVKWSLDYDAVAEGRKWLDSYTSRPRL